MLDLEVAAARLSHKIWKMQNAMAGSQIGAAVRIIAAGLALLALATVAQSVMAAGSKAIIDQAHQRQAYIAQLN